METSRGSVSSVSRNETYSFTKPVHDEIVLVAGLGIEGDSHSGVHVRHQSRVRADPTQPNLRQVHLIHEELFDEVETKGYEVRPGNLGENVTTRGIDLLGLPVGTILRFGSPGTSFADGVGGSSGEVLDAVLAAAEAATLDDATARAAAAVRAAVEREPGDDPRPALIVAGLRNPCAQINGLRQGLLKELIGQDADGNVVRKGGIMTVVLRGGPVRPGDLITAELPPAPHAPLERV
ncbi:MOSC domain-containing protein [Paractinoplanes lichenicola]|uniref:Transcription elongation factor n=1 Tax=Paractinoplanes lichenicola TaxID=2802976 RepID=A0ABS1VND6_9ACTN|nr:MOSC domain-containing protein [Actinoplanes lichenicola]MBL7256108.1 transcription elongation factor [Actinoplanes lichenicola]